MERTLKYANWWLIALLLARLLIGLAYSLVIPLGEAPDEADHHAYAAYIALEHRLPDGAWMTQAKHPPLYHVLAALAAGWAGFEAGFLRANPDVGFTSGASPNFFVHTTVEDWPWRDGPLAMHLARLISVLAGVGLVAATYALGREIWPDWPAGALAAAAFVAFLPESLFVGGAMNNDTLAALLATMALGLALWSRKPWHAVVTGVIMGLGLWAKVSVAALWPVVCLAMAARGPDGGRSTADGRRHWLLRWQTWNMAVVAGGVALLVTAPWFWRNRQLYGDWMGWPLVMATIDLRQGPFALAELAWLARGLFLSFWGKFGGAGHIPLPWPLYALWAGLFGASALGWLRRMVGWVRGRAGEWASGRVREWVSGRISGPANQPKVQSGNQQISKSTNPQSAIRNPQSAIVLVGAPLMTLAWLIIYSRVALGTDQGRLLFPAIAPLALLLVGGLAAVSGQPSAVSRRRSGVGGRHANAALVGWSALLLAVALFALVFGLWLPFAPPPAPAATEVASASQVGQGFGGRLKLVAYRWLPADANADQRTVVLYWRGLQPISGDLRTSLRALDEGGELIWEWKRSPGAGRFSTDRWPAGRIVSDVYAIPADLLSRAAHIEVGVRPFPEAPWLPVDGRGDSPFLPIPVTTTIVSVTTSVERVEAPFLTLAEPALR